ncbi:MAG: HEPN family nuclease [Sulfurimonas sp.]|uniref:HEPN family nuclease n=1 Tax=Sulfurimonas sp. TaxID=2022749 RepID=UPI003562A37F
MEWKNEKDFVCRTKHNLKLYKEHKQNKSQGFDFEVTQLVNSFLGLIVFIKEEGFQGNQALEKFLIDNQPETWDYKYKNKKTKICEDELKIFENYLKHLRNAIAHLNLKIISEKKSNCKYVEIVKIEFEDKSNYKKHQNIFKATLTIEQIEKLIELLYTAFLDNDKCKPNGTI